MRPLIAMPMFHLFQFVLSVSVFAMSGKIYGKIQWVIPSMSLWRYVSCDFMSSIRVPTADILLAKANQLAQDYEPSKQKKRTLHDSKMQGLRLLSNGLITASGWLTQLMTVSVTSLQSVRWTLDLAVQLMTSTRCTAQLLQTQHINHTFSTYPR